MRMVDELGRTVHETLEPERRWRWRDLVFLAAIGLGVYVLLTLSGCGGGGHKPRLEKPPVATPVPAGTPRPPARKLACWSYTYGGTPGDFADMRAAGVTAVMDYDQTDICARTADARLGIIAPFYYGRADTFDVIERITHDQAVNFAGCRDRVIAVYPVDEPDVKKIPAPAVELMIASAGREFPTVPRLVTFGEKSHLPTYAGLTWRGAEMYSRAWREMDRVRKRVADASILPVPRAFDNGGRYWGDWSDQDRADFVHRLVPELAAGPSAAVLFYLHADNKTVGRRDRGWRDLPATRAAIGEVCR